MEVAMVNKEKIKAEVFDRLIVHLQTSTELQNIDLMDLAGFCRNCLAKWYMEASVGNATPIEYEDARQVIYGMPYDEWKKKYQK
ncbi:MAG: hypothetical protein CML88_01740 [Rhodobiaceae bacterium]|nr:hypothetical protein [Rhodobiaceae bacterium]|tara:strand:+ start:1861 stop:2112 length:252 start_codon:yes stop_codon:yes gene_type:complete